MISEETGEGRELVDLALAFARDPKLAPSDRLRAVEFLMDRIFGKAPRAGRRAARPAKVVAPIEPPHRRTTSRGSRRGGNSLMSFNAIAPRFRDD